VNPRLYPTSKIGKRARALLVNDMQVVSYIAVGVPFEQEHYYFPAGRSGTAVRRDAKCLTLLSTLNAFGGLEKLTFVCGKDQIEEVDVGKEMSGEELKNGRYCDEDAEEWDYDVKVVKKMLKMVEVGKVLLDDFEG
jgi:hypothetical protein